MVGLGCGGGSGGRRDGRGRSADGTRDGGGKGGGRRTVGVPLGRPGTGGVEAGEPQGRQRGEHHREQDEQQPLSEEPGPEVRAVPAERLQRGVHLGEAEAEVVAAQVEASRGQRVAQRGGHRAEAEPAERCAGRLPGDQEGRCEREPGDIAQPPAQQRHRFEQDRQCRGRREQRQGQHQERRQQRDRVERPVLAPDQLQGGCGEREHAEHRTEHQQIAEELRQHQFDVAQRGRGQELADPGLLVAAQALAHHVEPAEGEPQRARQGGRRADVRAVVLPPVGAEREDRPVPVGGRDGEQAQAHRGEERHRVGGAADPVPEVAERQPADPAHPAGPPGPTGSGAGGTAGLCPGPIGVGRVENAPGHRRTPGRAAAAEGAKAGPSGAERTSPR